MTVVAQAEIRSDINTSNTAMVAGGGLLFALVDAGVNSSRAKKAEAAIQPLREALTGFDFDAAAKSTTTAIMSEIPWLQSQGVTSSKDGSELGLLASLDASPTEQLVTFEYTYSATPDFTHLLVGVNVTIAAKTPAAGVKPADRRKPKQLIYSQRFTATEALFHESKVVEENVKLWAADDARVARSTLNSELADIKLLVVRGLNESEADSAGLAKNRKATEPVDGGVLSTDGTNLTLARTLRE